MEMSFLCMNMKGRKYRRGSFHEDIYVNGESHFEWNAVQAKMSHKVTTF